MITEIINNQIKYKLSSPKFVISQVKINGIDISKYLNDETTISEMDISKNSGRDLSNADGTMVLNIIGKKYRIDLSTRPLTEDELFDFFEEIERNPKLEVEVYIPYLKEWKLLHCYRGDRKIQRLQPMYYGDDIVSLYCGVKVALIEL